MAPNTHPLLPAAWNVPQNFKERLGAIAGKQRAMEADGHLLLVLHDLPDPDNPKRAPRLFWRTPDGAWKSTNDGVGVRALDEHVRRFATRLDQLESEEERAQRAADYFNLLQRIVPLHRTARNLHAALQQGRDAVPGDRDLIQLRDLAGELDRTAELLHADIQNGLSYTVAHQAEEQARRSHDMAVAAHRLNVLVAIFFPIATLAAIFGMNLNHGLEQWNSPLVFWGILAAAFVSGLLLSTLVVRRPPPPPPPLPSGGPSQQGRYAPPKRKLP